VFAKEGLLHIKRHRLEGVASMEEHMFEKVKQLLVDELNISPDDVTLDSELSTDLGINSLELADVVLMCEEKFNITIDDEDLHTFITVGDVVNYLERVAG
jgi:acyl carrier protein